MLEPNNPTEPIDMPAEVDATKKKDKSKQEKEKNDRELIDIMRKLLDEAYHGRVFSSQNQDNMRLEFSHVVNASYFGHQLMAKQVIFNPNTHCITTCNDKSIHVWHPTSGKRLFEVTFDSTEKLVTQTKPNQAKEKKKDTTCRQISCICYS
jgi:hypothetical protein